MCVCVCVCEHHIIPVSMENGLGNVVEYELRITTEREREKWSKLKCTVKPH